VYSNGDVYEGQWNNDQRNGKGNFEYNSLGTLTCSNGDVYKGDWKDDSKNGKGRNV